MDRLTWYGRRLRAMGPAEIAWRGLRTTRAARESARGVAQPSDRRLLGGELSWDGLLARFRAGEGRPVLLSRRRAERVAGAEPAATARVLAAADRVRAGRVTYFGYPEARYPGAIEWDLDPLRGHRWPSVAAARLDHRTAPADPKWIWELNRLQHLPWLAQAWLLTGDEGYADAALEQLDGWIAGNPVGIGIAWRGGFEAGVRAISVALALQGLRDAPGLDAERFRRAVRALAAMARMAWRDRSRHSSANNHLVGELVGALCVAALLPELAEAAAWDHRAERALAVAGARQVLGDGAGAEQAFAYQVFTGDLLLVAAALRRAAGRRVPAGVLGGLERGAGYLAALLGDDDPVPAYGDDDDGFALRLDAADRRDPRGHLGAVAALTGHPAARRAGHLDPTARWLLGEDGERTFAATRPGPPPGSFVAPSGGLVVLRGGARRVTLDAGPLGYLSIAAHGHADALSLTLAEGGRELVGDPGAASYFAHPAWRSAHRSTAAHATVGVDGRDQSDAGGAFLWTRHARARLVAADLAAGYAVAEHDGYLALDDPVLHRRYLLAPGAGPIVVLDWLEAAGEHEVATAWPLAPDLEARPHGPAGHSAERGGAPALLVAAAATVPLTGYAVRGDEATALGWWSRRLEEREAAWLVGVRARTRGPAAIATVLWPVSDPPGRAPEPAVEVAGGRAAVSWNGAEGRRRADFDLRRPWTPPLVHAADPAGALA